MSSKKVILIADDESQLRMLVHATLEQPTPHREQFEILEAADGAEALSLARKHLPDMLILDWMMPKMTGY